MDSIVNKLEKDHPLFHVDFSGNLITWHSNVNLLRFLEEHLKPEMHTIETGAGFSTVVFTFNKCSHICIVPSQDEVNRIKDYCRKVNISLDKVNFMVGQSPDHLPTIYKVSCDLAFVDGAHRFPYPIVDWFYCANLLKEGGLIVIDDTDIISSHILVKFMLNDPHWEKVEIRENFAVFKKLGGHDYPGDWPGQPFSKNKIYSINDVIKAFWPSGISEAKEDSK